MALAFFIIMVKMIQESGECIDSPFQYSAKKLKESGGDYICSCDSLDPELLDFAFNEDGIEIARYLYETDIGEKEVFIK